MSFSNSLIGEIKGRLSGVLPQRLLSARTRLAAKFGPEISLRDLMDRFSYDCPCRAEARSKAGKSACGVYLLDFEQPRPADMRPGMVKLRLVKG
jgi:hypothetical protein